MIWENTCLLLNLTFLSKLCQIFTDSSQRRFQITVTCWGYEDKGQSQRTSNDLEKHLSTARLPNIPKIFISSVFGGPQEML